MKIIYLLLVQIFVIVVHDKKVFLVETEDGQSTAVKIRNGIEYNKGADYKGDDFKIRYSFFSSVTL